MDLQAEVQVYLMLNTTLSWPDPQHPENLYVGADIGVWHSPDKGANWAPLSNGLPEAPVFDLQVHPTKRLLRAATHGRGMYEVPL